MKKAGDCGGVLVGPALSLLRWVQAVVWGGEVCLGPPPSSWTRRRALMPADLGEGVSQLVLGHGCFCRGGGGEVGDHAFFRD